MNYFEATLLSMVLMLAILVDVLRFPLLKKDRGSLFFAELAIAYSIFLVITILICLGRENIISYPIGIGRILWALHFLSFPVLLGMWMHFNAINVIDNEKLVNLLSLVHAIPLVVLIIITLIDIPQQRFYPFNPGYEHMAPVIGTYYMVSLCFFFCLAMFLSTLGHRKELQGSFLFISMLLPIAFTISFMTFYATHIHVMFVMVNSFMMVLYYLIGQRDSIRVDSLTGLPSYTLLKRKLIRIFRLRSSYAVIFLDIENFRYFNSRYGQFLGDQMLAKLAEFLKTIGRANEVYRVSDDQFCICLPSGADETAKIVTDQIKERMNQPWDLNGRTVFIQVNMAVINIPQQAETMEEFKQATSRLLLEIKMLRNKSLIIYTRESTVDHERKMNIISALRESIKFTEQILVYYQPIYDAKTEQLVSAEALIRIDDLHLGFLKPDEFITLAEQTGLIMQLTQIMLAKVCRFIKQIPEENSPLSHIAMNLSSEDFESKVIGKTLLDIIEQEGVKPKRIGFEITESVVLQSYETVSEVMVELSLKKIAFALDDFGTGYSNLRALIDLPYDYVKLDKSVIHAAMAKPSMLLLLTEMLQKMGKCVIAEGVETKEQLSMVRSAGIERVQGYYFSKPLEEEVFRDLILQAK
ncbi:diguanylate cyclase (GGDEF) domain-containing protein [Sphaerochaeta pleomorpha str. Grapes]|uniref:Diguanylate cyclase (GGDEF) domain-containing protein n=1 Tax=Sphaerochaeta pleomorpha (strain ATCC BAA-1885 / DSM 22778 / Grapes) TaxID=158190 RepID=G8QSY7_SPHPG|nr:GGDEF domain-containing phosphodiesterase [Sphaerochaeta pleomorpha]AEV30169.1 diguanylate cyclase (GGDEF) domain-containing protein [Sphaerochaeta pleomorpha str. Grapes]